MDKGRIEKLIRELIEEVGEDPAREGLRDTPRRVAVSYEKLFGGYGKDPIIVAPPVVLQVVTFCQMIAPM